MAKCAFSASSSRVVLFSISSNLALRHPMNFYSDLTELGSFSDHDRDAIKIRINKQIVFKLSVIVCFARKA